jgi:hypothetical protein
MENFFQLIAERLLPLLVGKLLPIVILCFAIVVLLIANKLDDSKITDKPESELQETGSMPVLGWIDDKLRKLFKK